MKNEDLLIDETWKDIEGYEGIYQVSNLGDVKSCDINKTDTLGRHYTLKGKILKPSLDSSGYKQIILTKNKHRKSYKVHRLVAQAFIPNSNNLPQINHIDENKLNNNVSNLEWCTVEYNERYGTRGYRCTRHMLRRVKQIDKNTKKTIRIYNSLQEAEKQTKIKYQNISNVCRKIGNTAGGYLWKYC